MYTRSLVSRYGSIVLVGILLMSAHFSQAQDTPVLTLCEVFENLEAHSGKQLALQGELYIGVHGLGMVQRDCRDPFIRDGRKWPIEIAVILPASAAAGGDERSVKILSELSALLWRTYGTEAYKAGAKIPFSLSGLVVGLLHTVEFQKPPSERAGPGFGGGGGGLAAELHVKAVRDITISIMPEQSISQP